MNRFDEDLQRAAERLATEPLPEGVLDEGLDGLGTDRPPWRGVVGVVGAAAVLVLVVSIGLGQMMAALGPEATPSAIPDGTASPIPSPTPPEAPSLEPMPTGPVVAMVEEDGIRVRLELDHGQVSFGDRVWALVTIENLGADAIIWGHPTTCDDAASVAAHPDHPPEPFEYGRRDWPGDAGVLKRVAGWAPDPEWGFTFLPEDFVLGRTTGFGCTTDHVQAEVPPGGVLTYRGAWDVVDSHCMPAPPGDYSVQASFGYDGREDRELVHDELLTITVELPFRVKGPTFAYLSPGEAVDAALEDPTFVAELGDLPRSRWIGTQLEFRGDDWILSVRFEPDGSLVAEIDAITGSVHDVRVVPRIGSYIPLPICRPAP